MADEHSIDLKEWITEERAEIKKKLDDIKHEKKEIDKKLDELRSQQRMIEAEVRVMNAVFINFKRESIMISLQSVLDKSKPNFNTECVNLIQKMKQRLPKRLGFDVQHLTVEDKADILHISWSKEKMI